MTPREALLIYIEWVAVLHNVNLCDVLSRSRDRRICSARFACFHALRLLGLTMRQIGRLMDRDVSTVSHGLSQIA